MCTMKGNQDAIVYFKNKTLSEALIQNNRRSEDQYESVSLCLLPSTEPEKLMKLEEYIDVFLNNNSKDYYPKCTFGAIKIMSTSDMRFTITYRHRSNFQNGAVHLDRCRKFNINLFNTIKYLQITYGILTPESVNKN